CERRCEGVRSHQRPPPRPPHPSGNLMRARLALLLGTLAAGVSLGPQLQPSPPNPVSPRWATGRLFRGRPMGYWRQRVQWGDLDRGWGYWFIDIQGERIVFRPQEPAACDEIMPLLLALAG